MSEQAAPQPWQWEDEHWRKLVGRVRAGDAYRPRSWKGGARCALALSFDSDHETNELRDGGKSIGRLSWGQYGNRVGVPRILRLLEKYGVPASFYVPAVAALLHPDEQRREAACHLVPALAEHDEADSAHEFAATPLTRPATGILPN